MKACVDSGFRSSLGGGHHWRFGRQVGMFLCLTQWAIGPFCGKRAADRTTFMFLGKRWVLSQPGAETIAIDNQSPNQQCVQDQPKQVVVKQCRFLSISGMSIERIAVTNTRSQGVQHHSTLPDLLSISSVNLSPSVFTSKRRRHSGNLSSSVSFIIIQRKH